MSKTTETYKIVVTKITAEAYTAIKPFITKEVPTAIKKSKDYGNDENLFEREYENKDVEVTREEKQEILNLNVATLDLKALLEVLVK